MSDPDQSMRRAFKAYIQSKMAKAHQPLLGIHLGDGKVAIGPEWAEKAKRIEKAKQQERQERN